MVVGVLRIELYLPHALSLKDKRSVLKSVKDRLHNQFNVTVAEVDTTDKWQRACLGVAALGDDQGYVDGCLRQVVEWLRSHRFFEVIAVEQEWR